MFDLVLHLADERWGSRWRLVRVPTHPRDAGCPAQESGSMDSRGFFEEQRESPATAKILDLCEVGWAFLSPRKVCGDAEHVEEVQHLLAEGRSTNLLLSPKPTKAELKLSMSRARAEPVSPSFARGGIAVGDTTYRCQPFYEMINRRIVMVFTVGKSTSAASNSIDCDNTD